jgi:sulfate adenylyltransferase subunit 2
MADTLQPPPPTPSADVRRAVELRLAGCTLQQIRDRTGLSAPTVIGAYKRFLSHGWAGIAPAPRGRRPGQGRALAPADAAALQQATTTGLPDAHRLPDALWTTDALARLAQARGAVPPGPRALATWLRGCGLHLPAMADQALQRPILAAWREAHLPRLARQARQDGAQLLWVGQVAVATTPGARCRLLVAQTLRGTLAWMPLAPEAAHCITAYTTFLDRLAAQWPGPQHILLHGVAVTHPALLQWLARHSGQRLVACPAGPSSRAATAADQSAAPPPAPTTGHQARPPGVAVHGMSPLVQIRGSSRGEPPMRLTHLQRLEAESIHILREVVAECERPVML